MRKVDAQGDCWTLYIRDKNWRHVPWGKRDVTWHSLLSRSWKVINFKVRQEKKLRSRPAAEWSQRYLYLYIYISFSIAFIYLLVFALLLSLPPSRNSDPGSHSRLFSPPTHYGSCLAFISREDITSYDLVIIDNNVTRQFTSIRVCVWKNDLMWRTHTHTHDTNK